MNVVVQACAGREGSLLSLLTKVDALVVWDRDNDPMGTFLRTFDLMRGVCHLHLEDDAILTVDFFSKLEKIFDLVGRETVIQLFSLRESSAGYYSGSRFMMTVGFFVPAWFSSEFLAFSDTWGRYDEHPTGFDIMIADFLRVTKRNYYEAVPNLVNHRIGKSIISSRRSSKRVSKSFCNPWL